MHQFFVDPSRIQGKRVVITGGDVRHISKVLRMKPGDELSVFNGVDGREYRCGIDEIGEERVCCTLRFIKEEALELPSRIILFQGLTKGDKMEWIVQKAVELGVYRVVPVAMSRSVVRLDEKKARSRVARFNQIAEAAAKQSRRGLVPAVEEMLTVREALDYARDLDVKLLPYELAEGMHATRELVDGIKPGQSVGVFIGPEGGFEESEIEEARSVGFTPVTMGRRILRTETAGLVMLSWLMYRLEDSRI